jgi:hypothetical protein
VDLTPEDKLPPVVGIENWIPGGPLAQLVEQLTLNQRAVGSTPTRPTKFFNFNSDKTFTPGQWGYAIDTIAIGEPIENVPVVPVPAAAVLIGLLGSQWNRLRKLV